MCDRGSELERTGAAEIESQSPQELNSRAVKKDISQSANKECPAVEGMNLTRTKLTSGVFTLIWNHEKGVLSVSSVPELERSKCLLLRLMCSRRLVKTKRSPDVASMVQHAKKILTTRKLPEHGGFARAVCHVLGWDATVCSPSPKTAVSRGWLSPHEQYAPTMQLNGEPNTRDVFVHLQHASTGQLRDNGSVD
ncbi:hypothetical protein AXG93_2654s1000 [Marchantia polymorpha subsp. ruderalis]|uniref:Uncharacterized protein n=1 Tax=Marchantia polymorpha subsp. ruderalis TaxID=1480154 RepID=A0A176W1P1_MARPO|nr:hypothetical protein AXG93_2654s1000 [Marchantia polymorpha subsp. ruderalis]